MDNKSLTHTKKVLDYWNIIEILTQDDFCTDRYEIESKFKEYIANNIKNYKSIMVCRCNVISEYPFSIYDTITQSARKSNMTTWGTITVYLGRIKRDACIEKILKSLNIEDTAERVELPGDFIAIASFQLSANGEYIEESFSLSPILWAAQVLSAAHSKNLNISEYDATTKEFESKVLTKEKIYKYNNTQEPIKNINGYEKFSQDSLRTSYFTKVYKYIEEKYLKAYGLENYDDTTAIYYKLYKSDLEKENDDDLEDYLGLSRNFFSKDIKLAKEHIDKDDSGKDKIIRYVNAVRLSGNKKELLNTDYSDSYYKMMAEILDVKNAPLGKWPWKYQPAFMQQVAINLIVNSDNIFSVNGPPGTGKTTLLKEIVANNVVERARLLADIDNIGDVFEAHRIDDRHFQGEQYKPRYWFSLKNEDINKYGIVVASCNNAAVENVSTELPVKMLNEDKASDEIIQYFNDVQATEYKGEQDYYFTEYAKALFKSEEAWGMIAAPLGKKPNINNFNKYVLDPLYKSLPDGKDYEAEPEEYDNVRKEFISQYDKVNSMRARISQLCNLFTERHDKAISIKADKKTLEITNVNKKELEKQINVLSAKETGFSENIKEVSEKIAELELLSEKIIKEQKQLNDENIKAHKTIQYINIALIFAPIMRLFFQGIYRKLRIKKAELEEIIGNATHRLSDISTINEKNKHILYDLNTSLLDNQKKLLVIKNEQKKVQYEFQRTVTRIKELDKRIAKAQIDIKRIDTHIDDEMKNYMDMKVFDEAYAKDILGNDYELSKNAQIANPWMFKKYNLEREKLFGLALKLNKAFVLSSLPLKKNIRLLRLYWGYELKSDGSRYVFTEEDKIRMVPALFHTLMLIVPVISTTFASVGRLFKDVIHADTLGMLIVDEAGQAQPQMAVGALFRCRNAVIVGDPKQIEPVATDDLKALKESICRDDMKEYDDKLLSVQKFADNLNPYGAFYGKGSDKTEWVGSPLVVHRRCISPMFEISNAISYDGIMKKIRYSPQMTDSHILYLDG